MRDARAKTPAHDGREAGPSLNRERNSPDRGLRIIDLSAGKRAVWFDRNYRDATYVDIRPEVRPSIVADARSLPAEVETGYDLVVFDPPHKNSAATGNMSRRNYGWWTAEQINSILIGTAKEAHRITRPDALMAFKWNDHTKKLGTVLAMISPWWEPLFGHGVREQQRHKTMTAWVMLRRRDLGRPLTLDDPKLVPDAEIGEPLAGAPHPVIQGLTNLSMGEVREMDGDELRKLEALCDHWAQLAASERADRAKE